jgi:hypothetical protein
MRSLKVPLIVAAAVLATALIVTSTLGPGSPTPAQPAPVAEAAPAGNGHDHAGDPAHQKPAFTRTLAVYTDAEPAPSAHPERMRALLTQGKLPGGVVEATVLTDEDCAADAEGVSHCRNQLQLPNGKKLTVRHPHRMHDVPCMTLGETVRLARANEA